jgi:hypothetical protein
MTKLCSVCSTENRDEAQFCRACGTAFAAALPPIADDALPGGITCDECSFQNKPGIRYCANCGVSLLGTVIVPRARATTAPAPDPYAGQSPPPITYPSYATVAPYPPAPADSSQYPHEYDPSPAPDVPGPWFAAGQTPEGGGDASAHVPASPPAPRKGKLAPLIIGLVVAVLAVAGALVWWLMPSSGRAHPEAAAASAAGVVAAPVEPASATVVAPGASAPELATTPPVEAASAAMPASPAPTAETATPAVADTAMPPDSEAQRLAAEKQRREKAARDKAQRDAKAKALADQQAQAAAAAAARADQEAARRRAEEAQRAKPAVVAAPAVQAPVQPRGVREICAGRGTIGEAVCQSRTCGEPEHAGELICKQLKDADERRRNNQN